MTKTGNLFKKISGDPIFIAEFKKAQSFEELYELCKKVDQNITESEVEEGLKELISKNNKNDTSLLSDEELSTVAGGKMDFNKFKASAIAALMLVGGMGPIMETKASAAGLFTSLTSIANWWKPSTVDAWEQGNLKNKLVIAADAGNKNEVERLLNDGADINSVDKNIYVTALIRAAGRNRLEVAKLLIKRGADVNLNKGGWNALTVATFRRNTEMVKLLLENGANVNDKGFAGDTALIFAAYRDCPIEIAKLLLEHGADVNEKSSGSPVTPLKEACSQANLEMVKLLLEHGADINSTGGTKGWTMLMDAMCPPRSHMITILLDNGRYDSKEIDPKVNALLDTIEADQLSIVKLLIERGVDVNSKLDDGKTALMFAAEEKAPLEVFKLLIEHGADVNAKNLVGNFTALMYALYGKAPLEVIKLLLEHGADVNVQSGNGDTALMIAKKNNDTEALRVLLNHGVDVSKWVSKSGTTSLMYRCMFEDTPSVKFLLDIGADVNIKDPKGRTALDYAKRENNKEIIKMLEKVGAKSGEQLQ